MPTTPQLEGRYIRLEPLSMAHLDGLVSASSGDPALYRWSQVPFGHAQATRYIEIALQLRDAGLAVPFATVRLADGAVIGSTRFFDLERWPWPASHHRHAHPHYDVGEIGYTWLNASAIRTGANTEAKLLMLTQAFEAWDMLRICLHTDERNTRSRKAIVRIGGRFEGILRKHMTVPDIGVRDSAYYSVIDDEWPAVKAMLLAKLNRRP